MGRLSTTTLLQFLLLLGTGVGVSRVASGQQMAMVVRGPRFLLAPTTAKGEAVEVDVRRNAILRKVVSLNFVRPNIGEVLTAIERQAGLKIFYSRDILQPERPVSLRAESITVAAALIAILVDTNIDVILSPEVETQIALIKRSRAESKAQGGSLLGQVRDSASGQVARGAEVFLEGTGWRTETDTAGWYQLTGVDSGNYTLTARRPGYAKRSRRVTVREAQIDTVHFVLAPLTIMLDELVTTATGQQRRRDLGNVITTISADSVLQTAPIRNLTDLLATRVPGLTTQHTSGAPGDPTMMRLRGIGSALRGNDPIVIIDGVRVYSAQSDARSGNLTNLSTSPFSACISGCDGGDFVGRRLTSGTVPAPSPLDQIDPNIIEKIEVFKGPSAATLYGPDAANGVIVVTTKKGRPGPTRWNVSLARGRTDTPGRWPDGYYRWGYIPESGGAPRFCTITNLACVSDSLVQFQALNDPDLTVLGRGHRNSLSLTASGGSQALTYSITGSYSDEIGLLRLPAFEVERFRANLTREAPDWMREPHRFENWSVSSVLTALLSSTSDVMLNARIARTEQRRTKLEDNVTTLAGTYIDQVNDLYYVPSAVIGASLSPSNSILRDYYQRTTAASLGFTTALAWQWRPRNWFNVSAQTSINMITREDETLQPGGLVTPDDAGAVILGNGHSLLSTFNLQGRVRKPLRWGFNFETSAGVNYQTTATNDLISSAHGLPLGTSSVNLTSAEARESRTNVSLFGWYIEPRIVGQRISLSTGIRLDGGSTHGARLSQSGGLGSLLSLPKFNGSWVISEEPWFPFQSLFSSLRLRGAYGQAQVQPAPRDRLRIYTPVANPARFTLTEVGNPELLPERATEIEGGFDADMFDGRVTLELTTYRKSQVGAHMRVQLPPSVNGGGFMVQNIGNIRNAGLELVLGFTPVQTPMFVWNSRLSYSRNTNTLVKLGEGVVPDKQQGLVEGYPVHARWAKPILGYSDANANEVLERGEIMIGDSLVYMGRLLPQYTTALSTNVALFGGAIAITADLSYEGGATQVDETARTNWVLSRPLADPSTPWSEQAAVLVMDSTEYGLTQDVSTFRFTSFSVNYHAPARVARLLRAQTMRIGIQGANLGLHSTYRGKDPDVSVWSAGEVIRDTGQLPQPRTWQFSVSLQY